MEVSQVDNIVDNQIDNIVNPKIESINKVINIVSIGSDDPNNALEPNETAWILMDGPFYNTPGDPNSGFVGGQSWRKMAPIGYFPYGKESYSYGDENVQWNGSYWDYFNNYIGSISIGYGGNYPWEANWANGYTAGKITSTYIKTTNYPAVP